MGTKWGVNETTPLRGYCRKNAGESRCDFWQQFRAILRASVQSRREPPPDFLARAEMPSESREIPCHKTSQVPYLWK